MPRGTPSERFWPKVDKSGPGGCWLWTGAIDTGSGYGRFRVTHYTAMALAHRFAWTDSGRPLADGQQLDHLCRVRHCVNPDHLEPVTNAENVRRGLVSALRPARETCKNGHPINEENAYYAPKSGKYECRACNRETMRRLRAAKRG